MSAWQGQHVKRRGRSAAAWDGRGLRRAAYAALAIMTLCLGIGASPAWAASQVDRHGAKPDMRPEVGPLLVDLALTGSVSASSSAADQPATNATDGDASTTWSPGQNCGDLIVDLHHTRRLGGVGLTLGADSAGATVSVAVADRAGRWQVVPSLKNRSLPAGQPIDFQLPKNLANARYVRLTVVGSDGQSPSVGEFRVFGADRQTRSMSLGADLSFEREEELVGNHFTDLDGQTMPADQILRRHGVNYVRLRLWVDPPGGYDNLASDLAMAKRIKADGMKLLLDIHYSDFWADPGKQTIPQAWQGEDLPTLEQTVENYTRKVIAAFAAQGTPVDMVAIGNEITNGMLWPLGQVQGDQGWDQFAALLKAGIRGAMEGSPAGHRPRIMLHIDQGGNNAVCRNFFDHIVAEGVPFDVIGLSYYPFWHGSLSDLRQNVDDLAVRYGKDVVIAETQYPWTLQNGDDTANFVWTESQLPAGYPASPSGQISFVNDLLSILAQVPGGHGAGVFYWEPEWIPGVGWEPGAGTPNDNLTLFDFQGHALPSINIYGNPIRAVRAGDNTGRQRG
jgi:arabinogalactan endo-1,4-beta-galactosidase